jgi:tRNA pseudouridine38-40 synthase
MPFYRLQLTYDGTDFAGSQVQPGQRTVQGELERAMGTLSRGRVRSTFAGRTDRGVHAAGQVVAVAISSWRGTSADLQRALNARLPRDMAVLGAATCCELFSPRFDATWREYRYWIAPRAVDPFLRRYAWPIRSSLDVAVMEGAAKSLLGTHDFASFAGGGEGVPWSDRARRRRGTRRSVVRIACREVRTGPGPGLRSSDTAIEVQIAADGFLPQMVRSIVGSLVEIGRGYRDAEWLAGLLDARDRRSGAPLAPACGLTLWKVGFGDDEPEEW